MSKTILITGASKGVGFALATALSQAGHQIIGVGRSAISKDSTMTYISADLTTQAGCDTVSSKLTNITLDVIIHCMGAFELGPDSGGEMTVIDRMIKTNYWGPICLTEQLRPQLKAGHQPMVIFFSSRAIDQPHQPSMPAYIASKAALTAYTDGLRTQLNPEGIRVTVLHPFSINTWGALNTKGLLDVNDLVKTLSFVLDLPPNVQIEKILLSAL